MILNSLKNPFQDTIDNPKLSRFEKNEKLVQIFERERKKAIQLYGSYQIAKVNWLIDLLNKSQNAIR